MYSILLLILMAQITIASDQSDCSLIAQSNDDSLSTETLLDEILKDGSMHNEDLDRMLEDLELLERAPEASKAKASASKSSKRKRGQSEGSWLEVAIADSRHNSCSQGTCVKIGCPNDWKEWETLEPDNMNSIEHFDISGNYLVSIGGFDKFMALKKLALHDNRLLQIPDLRSLKNLSKLSLKGNRITLFNPGARLPNGCLEIVDCESNAINMIETSDDWTMKKKTFNSLNLANNPLSAGCFKALNKSIAGKGSVFFLSLRGTRGMLANCESEIGIDPKELGKMFVCGGGIELGRPVLSTDKLQEFKRGLNPGKAKNVRMVKGGILPAWYFCKTRGTKKLPQFSYCDSMGSIQPLDLTESSSSISASLVQFHDMSGMLNAVEPENELDIASSAVCYTSAAHDMSIDRILNSASPVDEPKDTQLNREELRDRNLSDGDQNSSDSTIEPPSKRMRDSIRAICTAREMALAASALLSLQSSHAYKL